LGLLAALGAAAPAAGCARYLRAAAREAWVMRGGRQLRVFGGPGHAAYLGCLNCGNGEADSVFAGGGTYNGEPIGPSIVNPSSTFVSPYSAYSACNPFATDPPVVVDELGTYYGRLTVSQGRSDGPAMDQLRAWIIGACGG